MGEPRSKVWLHNGAHDVVEEIGSDGTIGERHYRLAWLRQIGIRLGVERRTGIASRINPPRKIFGWHRINVKPHVGKAIAAELRREPAVRSGMVGLQMNARDHSGHRVDLAAKLWHEEAVHHSGGRELEVDR